MADISIQFYATESELVDFLKASAMDGIYLVAMSFRPFSIKSLSPMEISDVVNDPAVNRMYILVSEPILDVSNKPDFEKSNKNCLILDIGRLSDLGLGESWLACRTDDADAFSRWRKIAKELKRRTKEGVTGVNRSTGASVYYKSSRYSPGAEELETTGTAMIPVQGPKGPIIRLGNVIANADSNG